MDAEHQGKRRHWRKRVGAVAVAFAALALGMLMWAQPALAALVCPACFGFERLSGSVFVDAAMSAGQRARFAEVLAEGEERVARFYGDLRQHPTVLACASNACSRRLGGGSARGVSYGSVGLRLSPLGLDPVIVAHERSHIELHGRLGLVRLLAGAVPAWFDEGLAVVISDDPRYLKPVDAGDRCRAEPSDGLPSGLREWMRRASVDHDLYARAACGVLRWMDANGGRAGLLALVDRVAAGESFATLYNSGPAHER